MQLNCVKTKNKMSSGLYVTNRQKIKNVLFKFFLSIHESKVAMIVVCAG